MHAIDTTCLDLSQMTNKDDRETNFTPQQVFLPGHMNQTSHEHVTDDDSSSNDTQSEASIDSDATTVEEEEREENNLQDDQEVPHLLHDVYQTARDPELIDDFLRERIIPRTPWIRPHLPWFLDYQVVP